MICKKCGIDKPETDFYRSNKCFCKECYKTRVKNRRAEHLEEIRAYDRNRPNKQERTAKNKIYKAELRKNNPEKYDQIFHGTRKRYREKYREKQHAEDKLFCAVKNGKIIRPDRCSICGKECIPQGHHYDYSKPLDVIWVCQNCHTQIHKELREQERMKKVS